MQFILYRVRVIDAKTFEQTKPVVTENQEVEYLLESMSLTFLDYSDCSDADGKKYRVFSPIFPYICRALP